MTAAIAPGRRATSQPAKHPAIRRLTWVIAGISLLGSAVIWAAGSAMTSGERSGVAPPAAPARDLHIRTPDGVLLAATYWPGVRPNSPAVLVLHGVGASRAATAANAAWLASRGYAALTIDFRGHGESSMSTRSFGLRESVDAKTALQWMKREQGGAPVAVIGISMGGAAALIGPDGPLPADALILQAVYPDIRHAIHDRIAARLGSLPAHLLEPLLSFQSLPRFGVRPSSLSPKRALPRFAGPVLVIGGVEDRHTPPDETRSLFAAARGPKSLWLVARGDHRAICDLGDNAYRARVADFLTKTIGDPQ
jgi:pimeloyl-ACP methyl ester carboxylesterase